TLSRPDVDELDDVTRALRDWQRDDAPLQLHPGDLGWFWRFGANALAAAVRTWSQDGQFLAIGFLDGPDLLRMTVAPQAWDEDEVARHVVTDVTDPNRILPPGKVAVEL